MKSQLKNILVDAAQAYYTDGKSNLNDSQFDAAVNAINQMETSDVVDKIGWGYDVNRDTTPGEKCFHKYGTVGSLGKCRHIDEVKNSIKASNTCVFSLKLDGISVVLYYQKGQLTQALTRGDGTIGIDITAKVNMIDPTLSNIDVKFSGAIRGEILMTNTKFKSFNELHPEAKNPRNTTAGLINAKETSSDLKFLDIIVYTMIGNETISSVNYLIP